MIEFTVYGEATAQGRPRATTINGKARMYDPAKSRDYKDYVRLVASEHAPKELLKDALLVEIIIYRKIPKSFSKKKTTDAERGLIVPTSKPDADNYLKGISDALNGVIWKDDSQITDAIIRKRYSDKPRMEIKIQEI
jgi:Holliday junction resolvase RusA-like endonuclease